MVLTLVCGAKKMMPYVCSGNERRVMIRPILKGKLNAVRVQESPYNNSMGRKSRYAEMLEQQQGWLINALQELYRRNIEGEGWPGDVLETETNGFPLTHNLLTHLGILGRGEYGYPEINTEPRRKRKLVDDSPTQYSPAAPSVPSPVESHQQLIPPTPTIPAEKPSNAKNPSLDYDYGNLQYEPPEICLPSPRSYHDTEQWLSQNLAFFDETDIMLANNPPELTWNDPILYGDCDPFIGHDHIFSV